MKYHILICKLENPRIGIGIRFALNNNFAVILWILAFFGNVCINVSLFNVLLEFFTGCVNIVDYRC